MSFEEGMVAHGDATNRSPEPFSAPLHVWRKRALELDWQVSESLCAFAQPAGPTVRIVYETYRDEILRDLDAAMPVDIVLLGLHGAMMADGYDDCEGDLIARVREKVGPDVVIGAELDPHSHLTARMLEEADLLVFFREYPHVDIADRAEDLFRLVAETAAGTIRPVMRDHDCGMICAFHTPIEPMRSFVDDMISREDRDGVLSLSLVHGFPWGDHPRTGARALAICDGDAAKADCEAQAMAARLYALRNDLSLAYPTISEALARAQSLPGGPVVLADVSDNAGGGAPSDATFMLRAMIERDIRDVVTGIYWDPMAVRMCQEAGEGAQLDLRLGGKCGPSSGQPVDLTVSVRRIQSGLTQRFGEIASPLGKMIWLEAGGMDIVINDLRTQTFHPEAFTALGIDLGARKIIVVKSSQHFHAGFAPIARDVIHVATPGAIAPDYASIAYRKRSPDYWPREQKIS